MGLMVKAGIGRHDLVFPRTGVGVHDDPRNRLLFGPSVVEADRLSDDLCEDVVSKGRKHLLQLDLSGVFVGAIFPRGRPPQGSDFPYVVAEGGRDDGGKQEVVPLPQFLMRNVEGGLQDVVRVVVEGDALEDFEEVLMLLQVPVLAVRHFARPADHRGGVAALIE